MKTTHLTGLFVDLKSHWDIVRVDKVFDIQQGKQVSKENRVGRNQRPFLRTKNVYWGTLDLAELDAMHFTEAEEERLALQDRDLLLCEGGWVGRTALWRGDIQRCYYQNHLHRLRRKNDSIVPEFALHWFWFAFEYGAVYFGRKNDTTIPNLSKSRLGGLLMPLPEPGEQARIAATLSRLLSQVRERKRQVELCAELKDAITTQLMTGRVRLNSDASQALEALAAIGSGDGA